MMFEVIPSNRVIKPSFQLIFRLIFIILGSMYDWGNYWAKGIQCRMQVRPDIPYGGFFAQIGQLHKIYHIWY